MDVVDETREAVPAERSQLLQMLTIVTVALLPLPLGLVIWSTPGGAGDPNLRVSASPYDIPLFLLAVLVVPSMLRTLLRRLRTPGSWPAWLGVFAIGWFILAALVHPNWRAAELFFHATGGGAVAFLLLTEDRRFTERVVLATTIVAAAQAVLASVQSISGDLVGLGAVEASTELWKVGENHAGRGSFLHPYHLTTFLMLGLAAAWILWRVASKPATRHLTVALIALIGVAIPLTFSRAAMLALVVIVPIGLIGRQRMLTVALLLAVVAGTLLGSSGWAQRGETTADPSRIDSGRSERWSEAAELFESEPFFGVGPGGYGIARAEVGDDRLLPAHNVVAQSGAEAGAPGGLIAVGGLLMLAGLALLGGALGLVVGATVVNFHLLDAFPHVYPNGVVITGIWIGLVGLALRIRRDPTTFEPDLDATNVSSPAPTPA